jgi:hypothetical protein
MILQKQNWSKVIALRITDELEIKGEFPEDVEKLRDILEKLFAENKWAVKELIGTGIIEDDYFEKLS